MTAQGSAYARFRRALDVKDASGASTAALELRHVGLGDALELTLLYLDQEPARYDRAAVRLHARLSHDAGLGLDASLAALALLAALRGSSAVEAAHALADLVGVNRSLLPAAETLNRWAEEARSGTGLRPPGGAKATR